MLDNTLRDSRIINPLVDKTIQYPILVTKDGNLLYDMVRDTTDYLDDDGQVTDYFINMRLYILSLYTSRCIDEDGIIREWHYQFFKILKERFNVSYPTRTTQYERSLSAFLAWNRAEISGTAPSNIGKVTPMFAITCSNSFCDSTIYVMSPTREMSRISCELCGNTFVPNWTQHEDIIESTFSIDTDLPHE